MEKIEVAPVKPTVSFKEFGKIDIRVGIMEEIISIKNADSCEALI